MSTSKVDLLAKISIKEELDKIHVIKLPEKFKEFEHLIPEILKREKHWIFKNCARETVGAVRRATIDEVEYKILLALDYTQHHHPILDETNIVTDDSFIIPVDLAMRIAYIPLGEDINPNEEWVLRLRNNTNSNIPILSQHIHSIETGKRLPVSSNIKLGILRIGKCINIERLIIVSGTSKRNGRHNHCVQTVFEPIDFDWDSSTLNQDPRSHKLGILTNNGEDPSRYILLAIDSIITRINTLAEIVTLHKKEESFGTTKLDFIKTTQGTTQISLIESYSYSSYIIKSETHTIGNLLKRYIYDANPDIEYINYDQRHPSDDFIELQIIANDPNKLFVDACNSILKNMEMLKLQLTKS